MLHLGRRTVKSTASRDGTVGWGTSDTNIDQTIAARYASRKSLLAIELLNEESAQVHFETLKKYYKSGYDAVNRQVQHEAKWCY